MSLRAKTGFLNPRENRVGKIDQGNPTKSEETGTEIASWKLTNTAPKVEVRSASGTGGLSGTQNSGTPEAYMYMVDEQKASKEKIEELDFAKIASIEDLKGPKAVERYGEAAKEGVIVITTKGNE